MDDSLSLELKFKEDFEKLITSLYNLKSAIKENNPERISNYLNQFTLFLKSYFEKEEKFMEELKYPDLEHHKRKHDLFKKKIEYLFKKFKVDPIFCTTIIPLLGDTSIPSVLSPSLHHGKLHPVSNNLIPDVPFLDYNTPPTCS